MPKSDDIQAHYAGAKLAERIFRSLEEAGISRTGVTPEVLAPFDEFHVGGITATARVADRRPDPPITCWMSAAGPADCTRGDGCTECQVTGIDLTPTLSMQGSGNRCCGLRIGSPYIGEVHSTCPRRRQF